MSYEKEKHLGLTQPNPQFNLFRYDLLAENKTFLNILLKPNQIGALRYRHDYWDSLKECYGLSKYL